jgi:hypothetical protein
MSSWNSGGLLLPKQQCVHLMGQCRRCSCTGHPLRDAVEDLHVHCEHEIQTNRHYRGFYSGYNAGLRQHEQTSRTHRDTMPQDITANTSAQANQTAVTGCLQRDGNTFIVTMLNEPARLGVGTSGSTGAVEQEQLRQAAKSYRVQPTSSLDLKNMVGRRVRIAGTIGDAATLPSPGQPSDGKQPPTSTEGADIEKGDLARIDATSVSIVSDNCGQP